MSGAFDRRAVLAGLAGAGLCGAGRIEAQPLRPVRLLVARRPADIPSSNCAAQCIRGSIYDVSDLAGPIAPAAIVLSGRASICDVVERPWADNAPNVSAIPNGVYSASIRRDATKSWMRVTPSRAWRIELDGVAGGRSAIQFHYGLDEGWSQGCFIVGRPLSTSGSYCKLDDPDAALAALRSSVEAPGRDISRIEITVSDASALFAGGITHC